MKGDINDTLREGGNDAVRARHDKARKVNDPLAALEELKNAKSKLRPGDGQADNGYYHRGELPPHEESKPSGPRFKLLTMADVESIPPPECLVEDLLPARSITVVWGPRKCFKSFWVYDLAMHVARGVLYRDRAVKQGAVVYIALEGHAGYSQRTRAYRKHHNFDPDAPFRLILTYMSLPKDHGQLIADIRAQLGDIPIALIVIDTLNRSIDGSENDDKDMGKYIDAAETIRRTLDCAVIVVHHSGIDLSRPRGHTSLEGAVSAQIKVTRNELTFVAELELMKDGAEGVIITSRMQVVEIGVYPSSGKPITSLVPIPIEDEAEAAAAVAKVTSSKGKGKKKESPPSATIARRALVEAISETNETAPASNHIPANAKVTKLDRWRDYAYRMGISSSNKPRARQAAFLRASEYLIAEKIVGAWNDTVWIVGATP